ncbi:MAG: hypothetical protein U9P10_02780 [Thermodesulfobacteriota bacterium]|nr:hypothetical protein [Thermodesulfobacteriota bacterium]
MSTRGWYEYYTINPDEKQITLSMQFYKWGDATPGNALCEWLFFKKKLEEAQGCLPVHLMDKMLKNQLNELYDGLPENFSVAAFLFMLQRASEFLRHENLRWAGLDIPMRERPDYRLGYEIGRRMDKFTVLPENTDEHIKTVVQFIETGNHIRPWRKYGLTFSVLEWLQYLTQVTLQKDMGSIAGSYDSPWDHMFLYRFFIWISREDRFKIDQIAIELLTDYGDSLLSPGIGRDEYEEESFQDIYEELSANIYKYDIKIYSLNDAEKEFELTADRFWKIKNYEYPELTEAVLNSR